MTDGQPSFTQLFPGDLLPRFRQRCQDIPLAPDTMAGRYLLFCLINSAGEDLGRLAYQAVIDRRDRFDDEKFSVFFISTDPEDEVHRRLEDLPPGIRAMWDFDRSISRLLGAASDDPTQDRPAMRPTWILVDPSLHVLAVYPFDGGREIEPLFDQIDALPHPSRFAGFEIPAPILVLPNVFDPQLCRYLIGLYTQHGGERSGIIRSDALVSDYQMKIRRDYIIDDRSLIVLLQSMIARRVLPELSRLFSADITRIERYIVGCYSEEDGGHFTPHRDNDQTVVAHRQFAISINLNDDFDGGEVSFPEYNPRGIKTPPGWCVVFPAAILHAVSKVTRGRRYAFLPFVYDEGGAAIRQAYLNRIAAEAAKVP